MKKALLTLVALAVLYGGYRIVRNRMTPAEVKIGWLVDGMANDFNRSRPRALTDGLARDFKDETAGVGKNEIRTFLTQLHFTARDRKTKDFVYRVEIPLEERSIELEPGGAAARVNLVARFFKRRGEGETLAETLVWEVRIAAEAADGDDGWQITRTQHQTLQGKRL